MSNAVIPTGAIIEYSTSSGLGGNKLLVEVLSIVLSNSPLNLRMSALGTRKRPKGVVNRSARLRYIVRVIKKNGEPVKGTPLKFPNASTLEKGTRQ